ncbi:Piso0_001500 [Millerozyma farinosa CBS 7064]|uniref:Piso0_001500 protein n=1 Tax=Pichia sorbitophila (strain ATCC MYA-4447 / BCRC 22081 / CBS 7064 / NBRC 10061 / NRRL Y-12695) TaxID=559304 RepID=G8YNC0_PICSO|nr:Piso0_001500 [Millerozyma farinosa CBS 7064]
MIKNRWIYSKLNLSERICTRSRHILKLGLSRQICHYTGLKGSHFGTGKVFRQLMINKMTPVLRHKKDMHIAPREYSELNDERMEIPESSYQFSYFKPNSRYADVETGEVGNIRESDGESPDEIIAAPRRTSVHDKLIPSTGSFVEFYDEHHDKSSVGIVLHGSLTRFNENYKKLQVLSIENELLDVHPMHIKFHYPSILPNNWSLFSIQPDRKHEASTKERQATVNVLNDFVDLSQDLLDILADPANNQFIIAYNRFASSNNICPVKIKDLINSIKPPELVRQNVSKSHFHTASLYYSCHVYMSETASHWIVSENYASNADSNILQHKCSDVISTGSTYFANSITNMESITRLKDEVSDSHNFTSLDKKVLDLYMQQILGNPKSYDDLCLYFNIWEGREFRYVIDAMKFFIVFPHPMLKSCLSRFSCFTRRDISPREVFRFLEEMKIYNSAGESSTDIYLSSSLMGEAKDNLSVSSARMLTSIESQKWSRIEALNLKDAFGYLRNPKKYYNDTIVYGLPIQSSVAKHRKKEPCSFLAISLEEINARKFIVNIHIPDIVTKVAPNSHLMNCIKSSSYAMKSIRNLVNGDSLQLFDENFIKKVCFKSQSNEDVNSTFSSRINYGGSDSRSKTNLTCMTISFAYNKNESNPFDSIGDNVAVSFDSLKQVNMKVLTWDNLEEILSRKNEPSAFALFRHIKSNKPSNESDISQKDIHQVNFIYNIMRSHFNVRNIEGASVLDPCVRQDITDSSNLWKEKKVADLGQETDSIETDLKTVPEINERYPKSQFLKMELEFFMSNCLAHFARVNNIPLITTGQEELEMDDRLYSEGPISDEAFVSHNNSLLPNYHAGNYNHSLLSRDKNGYVSLPAHLIGINFLSSQLKYVPEEHDTRNLLDGAVMGSVKIGDIMWDYECILNQLQLLYCCHRSSSSSLFNSPAKSAFYKSKHFSFLKSFGYSISGPLSGNVLRSILPSLRNSQELATFFKTKHKRFWTLKMLEQRLERNETKDTKGFPFKYNCVVVSNGPEYSNSSRRLIRAFCTDLGIEVKVDVDYERNTIIGSEVECDKVLALNSVEGICILRETDSYI